MFVFVALYGVLASFVMSSVHRNRREERRNPAIVTLFGWGLMAFSLTAAVMLVGFVSYQSLAGGSVPTVA